MTEGHEENGAASAHVTVELTAKLYDELSPTRTAEVDAHLAACATCRNELVELERTQALLGAWSEPDDVQSAARDGESEEVAAEAIGRVERRRSRTRRLRLSLAVLAAAAALVFLITSLRVSLEPGRLTLSFALPGVAEAPALEELVRRVASEELAVQVGVLEESQATRMRDWLLREREEKASLISALAHQRLSDRQYVDESLRSIDLQSLEQHHRTREALFDLASAVAMKP
jgi:anti-sigma factor RsiW